MMYKNKKTGAVVKTAGKVSGGSWELLKKDPPKKPVKDPPEGAKT